MGDEKFLLPVRRASRVKLLVRRFASLPLLIILKHRVQDLGEVIEHIRANESGKIQLTALNRT